MPSLRDGKQYIWFLLVKTFNAKYLYKEINNKLFKLCKHKVGTYTYIHIILYIKQKNKK